MKKIFTLMAAALMSVAMWAGANDLLWDYSENQIPTSGSDKDAVSQTVLTYGGYVNDAPSTNLGLNGVKMNSSGFAYFTKAAVAGKLKLTYGPRKTGAKLSLLVNTWAGETPAADKLIVETKMVDELSTAVVDLTAEQNNIYITRSSSSGEGVLQKIQFIEFVPRTFVDFELVMCNMASEYDFTTLPEGVTASGTFNTDQHGYRDFKITVPVDGTVRFTIGDCQFGNKPIEVKNKKGEVIATLSYPKAGCYGPNTTGNVFQYIYLGDADTLTFEKIQYCNYFKAEAAEITPCEVTFKDQNGKVLSKIETYEGATLGILPETSVLPEIAEGFAFRGWFYTNGKKAQIGDAINGNTTIQAKVTPIETAIIGSVQTYDFANGAFYPEDHETVEVTNGAFHDATHGWYFAADGSIKVQVAGNAVVVVSLCKYSETGEVAVTAGEKEIAQMRVVKDTTADGTELTAQYEGEAGWLTISWTAKQYVHKVVVYNVLDFLEKDAATGYYIVPAGDVASFLLALVQAQSGDKIFLPNGTYDLGETCLTTISKNNIAIIGQSMDGTIIKNAPDAAKESIDKTATIKINKNVSGTYLQDLTIQNALDYYKSDNGRAVCLWDQGTKTVCKNVKLLSYQDTYYSNLQGALKYFEDCEIHGTVDFICGDGSVYFKNNLLYCEKRKKDGGGSDALTANNGIATDKGYVFEGCTVKSECPVVSMGRAWNNTPKVAFLNTLVDYSAGQFAFESSDIQRWTKKLMNANAWPEFGEFNTHLEDGTVLTPASNVVKFLDEKSGNATKDIETVWNAEKAATYTMAYTLGAWAETAAKEAEQAVAEEDAKDFEPDGIYLVEGDGEFKGIILGSEFMDKFALYDGVNYTVRKANARGGFGLKAGEEPSQAISNTAVSNEKVAKIIRDGKVIIIRGDKEFNVLGAQL